jgi:hypothetical protein
MASASWLPSQRLVGLVAYSIVSCGGSRANSGLGSEGMPAQPPNDGGSGSAMFGSYGMGSQSDRDGGGATNDGAPTRAGNGAAPPPLFAADSAPAGSMSDCKPGTYTGAYMMNAGLAEGGFLSGLISIPLSGTLSITLVGNQSTPHPGEFNNSTLTVAPGAQMSGSDDTLGSTFYADLSGQLDCTSRMFVGTLSNGVYSFLGDAASVMLIGSLMATYDPKANPLAFVNGYLDFTSPQVQGWEGTGTWSATLQ